MSDAVNSDRWEIFRKNIRFLRKYYKLTQENVADGVGCSLGCYQHAESKGTGPLLQDLIAFWGENYGITPNDLLLELLNEEKMSKIEQRIKIERFNKIVSVKVRRARY